MNDKVLDIFVKTGVLKDYKYRPSNFGEDQVILTFANGEVLVIDAVCNSFPGSTSLFFGSPQVK